MKKSNNLVEGREYDVITLEGKVPYVYLGSADSIYNFAQLRAERMNGKRETMCLGLNKDCFISDGRSIALFDEDDYVLVLRPLEPKEVRKYNRAVRPHLGNMVNDVGPHLGEIVNDVENSGNGQWEGHGNHWTDDPYGHD